MESPSELAESMIERDELRQMWETMCFEPWGPFLGGVVCTEPRGHDGGHCCTFETLDRYHELRLSVRHEKVAYQP
jgi:hypothetical protein